MGRIVVGRNMCYTNLKNLFQPICQRLYKKNLIYKALYHDEKTELQHSSEANI